jgi:hypothetical protein
MDLEVQMVPGKVSKIYSRFILLSIVLIKGYS